jgi:hypothetical protein
VIRDVPLARRTRAVSTLVIRDVPVRAGTATVSTLSRLLGCPRISGWSLAVLDASRPVGGDEPRSKPGTSRDREGPRPRRHRRNLSVEVFGQALARVPVDEGAPPQSCRPWLGVCGPRRGTGRPAGYRPCSDQSGPWAVLSGNDIAGLIAFLHQMLMQRRLPKVKQYLCIARNS